MVALLLSAFRILPQIALLPISSTSEISKLHIGGASKCLQGQELVFVCLLDFGENRPTFANSAIASVSPNATFSAYLRSGREMN